LIQQEIPENNDDSYKKLVLSKKKELWSYDIKEIYITKKPRKKRR
jgi:hypothetical protein